MHSKQVQSFNIESTHITVTVYSVIGALLTAQYDSGKVVREGLLAIGTLELKLD